MVPLRRSRTRPLSSVTTHVWQMPMRQPKGIRMPARSPRTDVVGMFPNPEALLRLDRVTPPGGT
jgi:hypothetical protein